MKFSELIGVVAMVACANASYWGGTGGSYGVVGIARPAALAVAVPLRIAIASQIPVGNVRIYSPPIDLSPKLLREHVTIHRTVNVPVSRPVPVPVPHDVPFPVPRPFPVPVDRPYNVPFGIPQPVHVDTPVPVPHVRPVPVPFPHSVPVPVGVPQPVYVGVPTPVAVPQVVAQPIIHRPFAVAPAGVAVVGAHLPY